MENANDYSRRICVYPWRCRRANYSRTGGTAAFTSKVATVAVVSSACRRLVFEAGIVYLISRRDRYKANKGFAPITLAVTHLHSSPLTPGSVTLSARAICSCCRRVVRTRKRHSVGSRDLHLLPSRRLHSKSSHFFHLKTYHLQFVCIINRLVFVSRRLHSKVSRRHFTPFAFEKTSDLQFASFPLQSVVPFAFRNVWLLVRIVCTPKRRAVCA